ncbi:MAG: T9SS type A sorting domain-containing protein [Bacteroidetes bacterium]|nr:T9SS type A sorting domain-containing protein [Bacteroidota bacterium]
MKAKSRIFLLSLVLFKFTTTMVAQQPTFTTVFGGEYDPAEGCAMVKTPDSNYLVAGSRSYDALVFKIDPAGNILWDKKLRFAGTSSTWFSRIISTHDSCFVAVGNMDQDNMLCVKARLNGDTVWSRSINLGFQEFANTVYQTSDNGFLVAGYSAQDVTAPYYKIALVKLDSLGNPGWSALLSCGTYANKGYAVKQTSDGGYILIGTMQNSSETASAILIKLTSAGAVSWSKKLDFPPYAYSNGLDVVVTATGYVCFMDVPGTCAVLVKTDFSGNVTWSRYCGAGSIGYYTDNSPAPTLQRSHDGGFAFVTSGYFGNLVKTDSAGIVSWTRELRLNAVDVIESLDHGFVEIGNGPIYGVKMSGQFGYQVGIIKSDANGNSNNCVQPSGNLSDTCTLSFIPVSVTTTTPATLVTSLHPVIANALLTTFNGCIDVTGDIDNKSLNQDDIVVFPNPVDETLHFKIKQAGLAFQRISIYNILGEMVFQSSSPRILRDSLVVSYLPEGIYMMEIAFREKAYTQKFVVRH